MGAGAMNTTTEMQLVSIAKLVPYVNNALSNLEWCTVAENNAHAISTGLFDPHAAKHELAIPLADWLTLYILYEHFGMSMCELGRINNVSHSTISKIVQRIRTILPKEVQHGT